MSLQDIAKRLKSRGNFGHAGRPGMVGGSISSRSGMPAGNTMGGGRVPYSVRGGLVYKLMNGAQVSVGELKVASWLGEAGFRKRPSSYKIVTSAGEAKSPSKEDLLKFATNFGIDIADKTNGQ